MREPPKSHARLWLSLVLLGAYSVVVLLITMSPIPVDRRYRNAISTVLAIAHRHGVPEWFGYLPLEFTTNIAMFVPLGFLLALALPRSLWWTVLLITPAFSAGIELTQGAFLPQRVADIGDVVANGIGGWLGAFASVALRAIVGARDKTVLRRAIWEYEQVRAARSLAE
ncbi:VanZ family protein [Gryllotalpicola reticulitermitis]|uniref:VanZ family protein n=1 Tax=Gryllotalpicola reticulitermitis TaxID=1184153 RepID=A0ABV8QCV1_9MICO